jgi:uncharacterized protein (DUF169 family)
MSAETQEIAAQLMRQLDLDTPPVQVSYLNEPPNGVPEHPGGVPSVCTFFAFGTEKPFYAGLPAHEDCEIGAFVLGVPPAGELGGRLMGMIGMMQKEGYLNPGEEAHVPHNATAPKFVAYGPLGSLPMPPTGVLIFARPKGAMLAVEAAGSGADAAPVPMNGRPMCAIMPIMNQGAPVAVSMGCVGSRIYTDMGSDKMVVGIRGDHLAAFAKKLETIVRANALVDREDSARKAKAAHPHRSK